MKVLLVSANTEKINMPTLPLGLAMVHAALQRAGHDVRFVDLLFAPEPRVALQRALDVEGAEVIGISVRNIDDQNRQSPRLLVQQVWEVVQQCRDASGARIVLGGAGYSLFPGDAGPGAVPLDPHTGAGDHLACDPLRAARPPA